MIKAGSATDSQHAYALWKTTECGCAAGITLGVFSTEPIPGAISDDIPQEALNFAVHYLQKILITLLDQECKDMNQAKALIGKQLKKLNDSISYISRKTGQGIYMSGTVCYIAERKYICQAFGDARIYFWQNGQGTIQSKKTKEALDGPYITDAIGGPAVWAADFCEGPFEEGSQLICTTVPPTEEPLQAVMASLIHTNQTVLPVSIYKILEHAGIPIAVLTIAQTVDYRKAVAGDDQ